jgi:hypothetical protein
MGRTRTSANSEIKIETNFYIWTWKRTRTNGNECVCSPSHMIDRTANADRTQPNVNCRRIRVLVWTQTIWHSERRQMYDEFDWISWRYVGGGGSVLTVVKLSRSFARRRFRTRSVFDAAFRTPEIEHGPTWSRVRSRHEKYRGCGLVFERFGDI